MTLLEDIVPLALLDEALEQGLVRKQVHPELPLVILNYTERAAYDGVWNEATLACRGLIYDALSGEVVARPFPKFFNYGQPGAPELDLEAWAYVTEKMDGSLGILYYAGDGYYSIATRGSFASDQALHATEVLRRRYDDWRPADGVTYLFEIVYPENRIVVDYGDTDDLFLLAMIHNETGESVFEEEVGGTSFYAPSVWPGPRVESHPYRTLAEALAAEPRPNCEGFVVSVITGGPDIRVKIKQADYVALHRIVTGLNKRTVWAHIGEGKPIEELIVPLPDEFRPWVEDVVAELSALVAGQAREIEREYQAIIFDMGEAGEWVCPECGGGFAWVTQGLVRAEAPVAGDEMVVDNHCPECGEYESECKCGEGPGWACSTFGCSLQWKEVGPPPRKEFALRATGSPWAWALFLRLDGRDYGPKLWRNAKPDPVTPAGRVYSEDVA